MNPSFPVPSSAPHRGIAAAAGRRSTGRAAARRGFPGRPPAAVGGARGVALVITLIMLAVVTIMAVAFLAVARRERGAVTAQVEQVEARWMADAGSARAQAEIAARLVAAGGRIADGFFVSTNYTLPDGLITGRKGNIRPEDPENVYWPLPNQRPLTRDQNERVLRNLLFDPRAPVFVPRNATLNGPLDPRFYLDLNRNGLFEPTYGESVPILNSQGQPVFGPDASGVQVALVQTNMVHGDPQWVGVLEDPTRVHSSSNRFVGRFAYVVVPSGRTLDLNYAHNNAKLKSTLARNGYYRNQGVGTWELNLAGYLRQLSPGLWTTYAFNPNPGASSSTAAASDAYAAAHQIYTNRQRALRGGIPALRGQMGLAIPIPHLTAYSDLYSDGPAADGAPVALSDDDVLPGWPGSDQSHAFRDPFELFNLPEIGSRLDGTVLPVGETVRTTNYTFYRLLSSLATDTPDGMTYRQIQPDGSYLRLPKLNINWAQGPNGDVTAAPAVDALGNLNFNQTVPFRRWRPLEWFTNAADRLVRAQLLYPAIPDLEITNGYGFALTNLPVVFTTNTPYTIAGRGGRQSRTDLLVTHRYDAEIHRLLQLAVNIYDASTNRGVTATGFPDFPTVLRPKFYRQVSTVRLVSGASIQVTNIFIGGFAEVLSGAIATNGSLLHLDPDNPQHVALLPTDPSVLTNNTLLVSHGNAILAGIPWVVGAKKGFPSFNQAFWQTSLSVTRRLEVRKRNALATIASRPNDFSTNIQYGIVLGRTTSQEAWNSYAAEFRRPVTLVISNHFDVAAAVDRDFVNGRVSIEERPNFFVPSLTNRFSNGISLPRWSGTDQGTNAFVQLLPEFGATNEFYFVPRGIAPSDGTLGSASRFAEFRRPVINRVATDQPFYDVRYPQSTPDLSIAMTNRLFYLAVDQASGRIIDFVNLKTVSVETNILDRFVAPNSPARSVARAALDPYQPDHLWLTNRFQAVSGLTAGITNQVAASLFTNYPPYGPGPNLVRLIISEPRGAGAGGGRDNVPYGLKGALALRWVLFRDASFRNFGIEIQSDFRAVSPIAPTRTFLLTERRAVNDPIVHYAAEDLRPGTGWFVADGDATVSATASGGHGGRETPDFRFVRSHAGLPMLERIPRTYAPWGVSQVLGVGRPAAATDPGRKDPGIYRSDHWQFPTNQFPTLGWLGRVHRGTPWQTVYLKSRIPDFGLPTIHGTDQFRFIRRTPVSEMMGEYRHLSDQPRSIPPGAQMSADAWPVWAGNFHTHPVSDWHLLNLFTTAIHENAARGLMSSNQEEPAAWAALLAEVTVTNAANGQLTRIVPGSQQLTAIVRSINAARSLTPNRSFRAMGGFLAGGALTVESPFLPQGYATRERLPNGQDLPHDADAVVERIPQQVLSLMGEDQPSFTIYAFGQALKPASGSLINRPGPTYGLCTNYQITGEFATKTVVRFDGSLTNLHTVVERFNAVETR